MARERIAIAGAGIGGLTAALALAERGFAVSVFEKAALLEEVGAGLQLSPNAARVLTQLGLGAALADFILEPQAAVIRRWRDGRELASVPLRLARSRWGAPYGVIHRADLQRILYQAAARHGLISLTLGAAVTRVVAHEQHLMVGLERGKAQSTLPFEVLVGADGLWSSVAREIGAGAAAFARKRAWRSIIRFRDLPAWMRAPVATLWLGPNAHVVHYPLRGRDALNLVLVTDDQDAAEGWSAPGDPRTLAVALRGWAAEIRGVVAGQREWRSWPLYHGPPGRPLVQGRIALMGDAAHPMLPFLAQGAALAIEDAAELAVWLDRARGAVETRLLGYAEARRARTHRIQQESWRNGERYHWRWPRSALRDGALRLAGGGALLGRYDWIYGWRPSSPPLPAPRRQREAP